jgi:hypothetical protein
MQIKTLSVKKYSTDVLKTMNINEGCVDGNYTFIVQLVDISHIPWNGLGIVYLELIERRST